MKTKYIFLIVLIILCINNTSFAQTHYDNLKSAEKQRAIDNERNKERDRQNAENNRPVETKNTPVQNSTDLDIYEKAKQDASNARSSAELAKWNALSEDEKKIRELEYNLKISNYGFKSYKEMNDELNYLYWKKNQTTHYQSESDRIKAYTVYKTNFDLQNAKLVADYEEKTRFAADKMASEKDNITDFTIMDVENPIGKPLKKQPLNFIEDSKFFYDGLAFVKCRSQYGYEGWTFKDKNNNILSEPFYKQKSNFVNGYAVVSYKQGEFCIINRSGKVVFKNIKTAKLGNVYDDVFYFEKDGKFGFYNIKGEKITKPIYDEVWNVANGFAKVKLDNKFGFIDKNGKVAINLIYDEASNFLDNYALVRKGNVFYKIDTAGHETQIDK